VQQTTTKNTLAEVNDDDSDFELPKAEMMPAKKRRLPPDAPFTVEAYRYSDTSELLGFAGSADIVILAVLNHEAFPSVLYKFTDTVDLFCGETQKKQKEFPASFKDLETALNVKFVLTPNPALQCQIPYKRGVYARVHDLSNLIQFLDTFVAWRRLQSIGGDFPLEIKFDVKDFTGLEQVGEHLANGNFENPFTLARHAAKASIPSMIFTVAGPSWSKMHPKIIFTRIDANYVHIRFEGETYLFRGAFGERNIQGRFEYPNGKPLPETASDQEKKGNIYARIIKKINVEEEPKKKFLLEALATNVLVELKICGMALFAMMNALISECCHDAASNCQGVQRIGRVV